jgi:hypothetical protein
MLAQPLSTSIAAKIKARISVPSAGVCNECPSLIVHKAHSPVQTDGAKYPSAGYHDAMLPKVTEDVAVNRIGICKPDTKCQCVDPGVSASVICHQELRL